MRATSGRAGQAATLAGRGAEAASPMPPPERMRAIVAQSLPHTAARISFDEGYSPMAPSDGNRRLLELLDRTSRDLGMGAVGAVDPTEAGAADVSFVAARVDMALDGLGLAGTGGHTVEETADLTSLGREARRVVLLTPALVAT